MSLSVRQKIAGLALFAPLALGVVLGPLVATKWTQVEDKVGTGVTQIVENAMTQNARDLWALAESAELSAQRQVDTNVKLAKALIESGGGLRAAKETAEWSVDGQKMQLPRMVLGNTWLGQSRSFSERAPLVDTVTATASGTCTVFQRINAQGDMLRVATTLKTPDGNRALGVPLYARDATPTISAILSKQSFRGRSFLDGAWHAVAYEPLVGADGEVLGMVGVGVPCDAKGLVRAALQRVKVGTTGYVFVLGGKGALRGNYILSKDAKRDGENIWEAKDASGRPFVQGMVEQALSNKPGEATTYRYPWTNEAGKPPVEKIAAIAYFEPWDWVIGVSGEIADVEPISAQIKAEMGATARLVGGLALFLVLAIAGVGLWVGKRLSQPVVEMCRVADRLAEGDIAQEITHHGGDELGRLADSFRHMVEVQQGRVHLAEQIAAGDLSGKVVVTTDKDTLGRAMQHMQERIGALVKDVRTLGTEAVAGHLAFRADPRPHQGEYRNIVEGINDTLDAVIGPLDVAAEYVERISRGDIPDPITDEYRGDFAEIRNNLNRCIEAVRLLVSDARGLAGAAVEGRLATRVDAARHQGDFRRVIEGVNETLDAVIGPLNVAAEYVERIARGDIPAKITEAYRGDFAEIRNNLNRCIDAVNLLVADADTLAAGAQEGRLSVRADASRHGGDFQRVIEGVNRTLDCVIGPLDEAAGCIARIAAGDLPPKISSDFKGDFRALKDNLNRCIDTIHALVADATMLAEAAVNGDLDKRADATRHQGDFKRIIDGVNGSLDALVGPLSRAIAHLEHLAAGQVDEEITREEKGDYVRLKDSFNQTFRSIRALIADARKLSEGAVAGKLATRADASAHRGDFRKIIEGVNATLDAVIGPLNVAAEYVERISRGDLPQKITEAYAGDFNEIRNNLNTCIDAITALVTDARMLAAAATEGRLGSRADATRHGGDFRRVIEGVNTTLDALTGPLKASAECLARIARGDVPDPITAEYRGEFNAIKDSLNTCIHTIDALVEDTTGLAASAVAGDLSKRGDASRHQGDFKRIVQGVNGALDALVDPLSRSITHLEHLAAGQVDEEITREEKGDYVRLKDSFNQTFRAINALIEDANQLAAAAVEGRLSSRADVSRHRGDFKRIIEGFNGTLDAVIGPLSSAADCVSKIAAGAIPPRLDTAARGEYESLRQNLNGCIAAVGALVADANLLSEAALAGRLAVRADASRHHGDFKRIVDGFNGTLDAVMGPVNAATSVLQRLADQDLRARVNGEFQGDHARLKEVVNTTAQSLHDALSTVAQTVEQVASAAEQIASTSQSVAQGSSEQAAALEETSGNLEEMSGRTKQSAENTQQAHALARTTKSVADQGALAMGRMGEAMGRIRHGAEGTAEIIRDINEIAFQTNLLALNAAVEAARAGDAGRGFAVVAEEVRSLAQRAKEAAKRTEDLIRESVKLASEGEALSHEVAGNLGEIVSNVGKVTAVVQEIAAASQEQSKGIEQINKALVQMDKVTQQAAGNAEESSSAAAELSTQSQSLAALVGRFQLERAHEAGLAGALPRVRLPGLRSTNGNGNGHFAHGNGHLVGGNGHATPLLPADSPREERPKV